jgi:hypothetical protein
MGTLLHATIYVCLNNLLNVLVQIANKMGLQKKTKTNCVNCLNNMGAANSHNLLLGHLYLSNCKRLSRPQNKLQKS